MPFQAIPIAMQAATTSPLSKLLYIRLTATCDLNQYFCWCRESVLGLAHFSGASREEVRAALLDLHRLRLITWIDPSRADREVLDMTINLPVSDTPADQRRRIKASDDQIALFLARQDDLCATCSADDPGTGGWHVDHVIPRSIGGLDVEENCQVICSTCNLRKGKRVHWVDFLGGRR